MGIGHYRQRELPVENALSLETRVAGVKGRRWGVKGDDRRARGTGRGWIGEDICRALQGFF